MRGILNFVNRYKNAEVNLLIGQGRVKVFLSSDWLLVSKIFKVPADLTKEYEEKRYPVLTLPFQEFYRRIADKNELAGEFGNILERCLPVENFKLRGYDAVHEDICFGIKPSELKRELFFLRPFARGERENVIHFRFSGIDCSLMTFGIAKGKVLSFGLRKIILPGIEMKTEAEQDRCLSLDLLYDFLRLLDPKQYVFFSFGGERELVTISQDEEEWTMNLAPVRFWTNTHKEVFDAFLKISG